MHKLFFSSSIFSLKFQAQLHLTHSQITFLIIYSNNGKEVDYLWADTTFGHYCTVPVR